MIVVYFSRRRSRTLFTFGMSTLCAIRVTVAEHVLALVALLEVSAFVIAWLVVWVAVWVLLRLGSAGTVSKCIFFCHSLLSNLRVSWAVGTADVAAVGTLLASRREQSRTFVAGTANALSWLLEDEILATLSGWLGDLALGVGLDGDSRWSRSSGGSSGSTSLLLALVLLWWRPWALLAAPVLALEADLLSTKLLLALVAGAVNTKSDLLLDTLSGSTNIDRGRGWVDMSLFQDLLLLRGRAGLWSGRGSCFAAHG